MGINKYYDELFGVCNIYGFKSNKVAGKILGDWPDWDGEWVPFEQGTNYDAFLFKSRKGLQPAKLRNPLITNPFR
jgi:hypothetical protein